MAITYQSRMEGDSLCVVAEGSATSIEEALQYVESMYRELRRTGLSKLLVYETKLHVHMNLDDIADVIRRINDLRGNSYEHQEAVICSEMVYPLYRHVFEPVKRIKVFVNEAEAREWLAL